MALSANSIPSVVPFYATPKDAALTFADAQTLTATGYINNTNAVIDLGGSNPVAAAGRFDGMLAMDITALKVSAGDETYRLMLAGSNDSAFGNGNVENLLFHDFAAASSGRIVATILGASPTIPPTNLGGTILQIPFTNLMQRIVYRYLKLYAVLGGTSPSVTLSAWISKSTVQF